jgi:SPP1 gp7 family putative phage head morphogenesis protein
MQSATFGRLADLYARRMERLFAGQLWSMVQKPGIAADIRFYKAALTLARAMAAEVGKQNAKSWREAAMKSYRGRQIYEALQAELKREGLVLPLEQIAIRNAQLISSVPQDIAERITARAAKLRNEGKRAAEIEMDIRAWAPQLAKSRIKLIARTEIGRAEGDVTRIRAQGIGLDYFAWATSDDQRVRKSHKHMNGVVVNWNDLPSPEALVGEKDYGHYFPGGTFNCRCVSLPVADLSELTFPVKLYSHGSIRRVTRAEFQRLAGVEKIAA